MKMKTLLLILALLLGIVDHVRARDFGIQHAQCAIIITSITRYTSIPNTNYTSLATTLENQTTQPFAVVHATIEILMWDPVQRMNRVAANTSATYKEVPVGLSRWSSTPTFDGDGLRIDNQGYPYIKPFEVGRSYDCRIEIVNAWH